MDGFDSHARSRQTWIPARSAHSPHLSRICSGGFDHDPPAVRASPTLLYFGLQEADSSHVQSRNCTLVLGMIYLHPPLLHTQPDQNSNAGVQQALILSTRFSERGMSLHNFAVQCHQPSTCGCSLKTNRCCELSSLGPVALRPPLRCETTCITSYDKL